MTTPPRQTTWVSLACLATASLLACEDDFRPAARCENTDEDAANCDNTKANAQGNDTGDDASAACEAVTDWEPATTSVRVETLKPDTGEPIVLFVEITPNPANTALQVRVCKLEGYTFLSEAITVRLETTDRITAYFDAELAGPGERCTEWGALAGLDHVPADETIGLRARIIAPAPCSPRWDETCLTPPVDTCGFCWYTQETRLTRTCRSPRPAAHPG